MTRLIRCRKSRSSEEPDRRAGTAARCQFIGPSGTVTVEGIVVGAGTDVLGVGSNVVTGGRVMTGGASSEPR